MVTIGGTRSGDPWLWCSKHCELDDVRKFRLGIIRRARQLAMVDSKHYKLDAVRKFRLEIIRRTRQPAIVEVAQRKVLL